jgi:hypothetical protein
MLMVGAGSGQPGRSKATQQVKSGAGMDQQTETNYDDEILDANWTPLPERLSDSHEDHDSKINEDPEAFLNRVYRCQE